MSPFFAMSFHAFFSYACKTPTLSGRHAKSAYAWFIWIRFRWRRPMLLVALGRRRMRRPSSSVPTEEVPARGPVKMSEAPGYA